MKKFIIIKPRTDNIHYVIIPVGSLQKEIYENREIIHELEQNFSNKVNMILDQNSILITHCFNFLNHLK